MLIAFARFAQSCPVDWHSSFFEKHTFEVSIMQLTKLFAVTVFATVALMVTTASAQVNAVRVTQTDNSTGGADLANHVTNDLSIDFTGQLSGLQLLVDLTAGSIYQNAFGGNLAPNGALLPAFPALAFDTFVTLDSLTQGGPHGEALPVGGAVNLGGSATAVFTTSDINQGWSPAAGVSSATSISDFLAARVTLTSDATGTASFLASSAGVISAPTVLPIVNGIIGGGAPVIPEPSTVILLAMGALGLVALKRRNG